MADAVYVDVKKTKSTIVIKPKPPFKPVFRVVASRKVNDIRIVSEPIEGSSVFLVRTGEIRSKPKTRNIIQRLVSDLTANAP